MWEHAAGMLVPPPGGFAALATVRLHRRVQDGAMSTKRL